MRRKCSSTLSGQHVYSQKRQNWACVCWRVPSLEEYRVAFEGMREIEAEAALYQANVEAGRLARGE